MQQPRRVQSAPDVRAISSIRPRAIVPGTVIAGRYRVAERLAEGDLGGVYRAIDAHDGCAVAIKLLSRELVGNEALRRRFLGDARAVMAVAHDGVIGVLDVGQCDDGPFHVMELVHGKPLREAFLGLDHAGIVRLGVQLCDALAAAHDAGVVHRALRPENVLVSWDADGAFRCKVIDFGGAKLLLAGAGHTRGAAAYLAPEQGRAGGQVDARADIYALGIVLYELIAGRTPFAGLDPVRQLMAHQHDTPPALARSCPPALARAVMHCLEKSPDERPADMREVAAELAAASLEAAPPSSDGIVSIRGAVVLDDPVAAVAQTLASAPLLAALPHPAQPHQAQLRHAPVAITMLPPTIVQRPQPHRGGWLASTVWIACLVIVAIAALALWVMTNTGQLGG